MNTPNPCTFEPISIAARHPITFAGPAVDFFEGALLGNGGLGAVVTTRPDAVVIRFGHNEVWDVRVAEANRDKIGTFKDIFERISAIPATYNRLGVDLWYRDYLQMARENYAKPYPRPFPCGSLVLGFDRRQAEVVGHKTDIATGLCTVELLVNGVASQLEIFVDMHADRLWIRLSGSASRLFNRVRLVPDPETPEKFPQAQVQDDRASGVLAFRQTLPCHVSEVHDAQPGDPGDRAFRLSLRTNAKLKCGTRLVHHDIMHTDSDLEATVDRSADAPASQASVDEHQVANFSFIACVSLEHGMAAALPHAPSFTRPDRRELEESVTGSQDAWRDFWSRSGVRLADTYLEQTWYWNLYFFNCSVRPGVTCPGLFANWSYRNIGTAWHGDYHLDYNTQQPFWLSFSSNHVDKHLPYVDLVNFLLTVSTKWAREYYRLRGAFFPTSSYPVEMSMVPYPLPHWGWSVCVTPWTVQSLWWHFNYTMDIEFLRTKVFRPLKESTLFLVEYMMRPEAHGPQWGDDRYHIFPTVPPELYGLRPGFQYNHDCLVDLTLTRFVLRAFVQACTALGREATEQTLIARVNDVLDHFPEYQTVDTATGPVFVSVKGENPEIVYNVPCNTMTVFPGEEHGIDSPPSEYEIAANSYRRHRNEGGNELVFLNLTGARLGLLDLERFKRQVRYCTLPNGTCADKALQIDGRYTDDTTFDFMARMGVWFENFALPAVIDECLMHSYNGTIRLCPNWPLDIEAEFRTLRAVGAFLVSAKVCEGRVDWVEVESEVGTVLRLVNPWRTGARCRRRDSEIELTDDIITLGTSPGEHLVFTPIVSSHGQTPGSEETVRVRRHHRPDGEER